MNGLAQLAIQQKFLIVLQSNETRFRQSTVDLKAWGLRQNKPPEAPFVILPCDSEPISESYICSIWADTKLPLGFVRNGDKKSMKGDNMQDWYKQIQGKQFVGPRLAHHHYQRSDDEAMNYEPNDGFDEDDEIPVKFIIAKDKIGKFSGCQTVATPSTSSASSVTTKVTDSNENSRDDPFDETSRDSEILPPKPPPQSKRRLRKRSAPNVSGPPLKKIKIEKLSIPSPEDSSNDDDTSSRSTLDLIIPPPKDFQGSNNPFNPVYVPQATVPCKTEQPLEKEAATTSNDNKKGGSSKRLTKIKGASKPPPENSKIRIVRTIRRRLSAKDLIIGPNQEVKYKKKSKHRNEDVEVSLCCFLVETRFYPFLFRR